MEESPQIKHAQRVARQLVALGYADRETARGHFKDYLLYLNLGFDGNFAQILHARKVIDEPALHKLNSLVPPLAPAQIQGAPAAAFDDAEGMGMTSMVLKLPGRQKLDPSSFGPMPLHESAHAALPESTLPLPDFDAPPDRASRSMLPSDAGSPLRTAGMTGEDLLAFDVPKQRPRRPSQQTPIHQVPTDLDTQDSEEDSRPDGTLVLPDGDLSTLNPKGKNLAGSSAEFAKLPLPGQKMEYSPIEGWGVQSTPSADSGSRADTGEVFWKSESGEEQESPFLEPKVGGFMGEFELLEVLGQGGMGIVFKVAHQGTDRLYALKVLRVRKGAKTETRRKRFRTEVQAMQRLKHKNIVGVHGYGRDGPFDWYVMDYVEGKDLSSLLKAQALGDDQKLEVYSQICQAIVHAHGRGVIHRDLKPQNVLVNSKLKVFILDFGLAKLLDDEEGMTHTGSALGTPFYMSPEQIATPRDVGPRADVFALGVVLYEMMTGKRPFTGHSAGEVGNKILTVDPPPPSQLREGLHANLDAICLKALEKGLDRRYQSAEALHKDLQEHRAGKSVRGESQNVAKVRRWFERNRSGFMGGLATAALILLLVAVVGFALWLMIDT